VRPLTRARSLALFAAAAARPQPARAQTAVPIRIGASTSESYGQPYYALDAGFIGRAGLNADVARFANAGVIAQAVAGNALDVGIADFTVVANAVNRGVPLVFFAGSALYSTDAPTTVLCVDRTGPVRSARDLEGRAVGIAALGSLSDLAVRAWLDTNGADLAKIKFVEAPPPSLPGLLLRGTIGAAFITDVIMSDVRNDVRVLGKAYDAIAKRFFISSWFTTRDWLAKNTDAARRLFGAIDETARWVNAHPGESGAILAKRSGLELDRIKTMHRNAFQAALDLRFADPVVTAGITYKIIEKPIRTADLIVRTTAQRGRDVDNGHRPVPATAENNPVGM
jgi:NitT/TauT family transport system substrate-binding protein